MKYFYSCLAALLCLSFNLCAQTSWFITGNSGTVDKVNFVGTTDNVPLNFRINNVNAGRMDSTQGNVALGFRVLDSTTNGSMNVALGYRVLRVIKGSSNNVAIGSNAMSATTSAGTNVAIGSNAMSGTGSYTANVAIGSGAMSTASGTFNTCVGTNSLRQLNGSNNVAIGYNTGGVLASGSNNTFVGFNAASSVSSGSNNTCLGRVVSLPATLNNNIIIADGAGQRRINVDSIGNFMINTTTPMAKNTFAGTGYFSDTLISNKILFVKGSGTGTTSSMLVNNSAGAEVFRILDNGNVGIGIASPQTALAVAGTISTKKVKVTQTGWPDYVFSDKYQLPDLTQLEQYILQHQHLPGIPTAAQVEKDGADLGDNQAVMLQKIEELTLYVIQQNKEIEHLKQENQKLQSLQSQLDELKKEMHRTPVQNEKQ